MLAGAVGSRRASGKVCRVAVWAAAVSLLGTSVARAADGTTKEKEVVGITLPSDGQPRELKFEAQGTIKSVEVKPGDRIKAGQVLMKQDDRKEVAELKALQDDVSDITVRQAEVQVDVHKADVKRLTAIHADAQNDAELEKAQAELKYSELQVLKEKQDNQVKKDKIEHQQAVIDMMQLRSPVDGYVLSVDSQAGEIADPQKPALKVVANDPLLVQLTLPSYQSQVLKLGRKLRVSYDRKNWVEAEVCYIAPQADGTGSQSVRLKLPNPQSRDSGLQIFAELPSDVAGAQPVAAAGDVLPADAATAARTDTGSAAPVK
jgi:multidrug efflux pump subunit AcrA (membrane-fusion protein)